MKRAVLIFVVLIVFLGVMLFWLKSGHKPQANPAPQASEVTMEITSPAFQNNSAIPAKYTCDGENISPSLKLANIPSTAKSLAFILDDPDAPAGTWTHWTWWNAAPALTQIPDDSLPLGAVEGKTSFGQPGYGGPCPPSGIHHYRFKLYALDVTLNLPGGAARSELEQAMSGHVLAQAEYVGTYQR